MNCNYIQPDGTYVWDATTNTGSWTGPNTCTLRATDSVTGEEEQLVVPFQPQLIDATVAITVVVGMHPPSAGDDATDEEIQAAQDASVAYNQHYNNMLWACATALDRWPTCNLVTVDGILQAQVNGSEVAVISNDDEEVHPIG